MHTTVGVDALARHAVQITGEGPTLLLIHGYGCDQGMWNPLKQALPANYRIVSYDLAGMGRSDPTSYDTRRHASLEGHVQDLLEVVRAVGGPVFAVGHSVSAVIAGLASIQDPALFSGLVMLCPNPCYLNEGDYQGGFQREDLEGLLAAAEENYQGWAGQLASLVAGEGHARETEQLNERFCRNDPAISRHFAQVTFFGDNRADMAQIHRPTLLVEVSDDVIAPASVGEFLRKTLPQAQSFKLHATGHAPHMTHPEETAAAIDGFIERLV